MGLPWWCTRVQLGEIQQQSPLSCSEIPYNKIRVLRNIFPDFFIVDGIFISYLYLHIYHK